MLRPRRKCSFNANLQKLYPFMQKTLSGDDVKCKCGSVINISSSGRTAITRHLGSVKHQAGLTGGPEPSPDNEKIIKKRFKLSEMKIEELINLVKLKPGLYEKKSNLYQRRDWREKAWEAIADELHEDETVCKSEWKFLHEQFNKTVKYIKRSTSNEEANEHRLKYKYFENLLFLNDDIKQVPCKFIDETKEKEEEVTQVNLQDDEFWTEIDLPSKRSGHFWENESEEAVSFCRTPTPPLKAKRKKKQYKADPFQDFPSQSVSQIGKSDIDGVDHFFLSISSNVKNYNLTASDLAILQCKIMSFSTIELEKLKNKYTNG